MLALLCATAFKHLMVEEHITTVFVFAVFLIAMLTDSYAYGISAAVVGTLLINYAFTYPFYALNFIIPTNLISAVIMLSIAVLTGMLSTKAKRHEMIKADSEKEKMRANLLRAVSHDLRTPLTSIYSSATMLCEDKSNLTNAQKYEILMSVRESSEWLLRMVENLLSITRIDCGQIKLTQTPTVLEELIDSVITKFSARYPNQIVTPDIPNEVVVIPMDSILIEQVILNMLENAVQHAKGITTLTLKVFVLGKRAIFEIADDGAGINKERLDTLFSGLYIMKENNVDGNKRNFGIGLSVCATIIKAHGGEISAENRKSGGALFRFELNTEEYPDV